MLQIIRVGYIQPGKKSTVFSADLN